MGPTHVDHFSSVPKIDEAKLQQLLTVQDMPLVIRPDDTLAIQVVQANLNFQVRVERDNSVTLPLVGRMSTENLTAQQFEKQLIDNLVNGGFVLEPQVTVVAVNQPSAVVVVNGRVTTPGTFPALGTHTINEYISRAGGLKDDASWVITLKRPGIADPISVPLGPDPSTAKFGSIPVFAGDEIRVAESGVFYVVGAFRTQGAFPLRAASPVTVLQAAALAGGVGFQAANRSAYIIRTVDGNRVALSIDMGRISKGKAADLPLHADDILYVPTNALKAAIKGGGSGIVVSAATALVYTGVL
jgi:polysaccharide export outer membrane protein